MCSCRTLDDHAVRTRYVEPAVGDDVVRYGDDSGRVGLLYHLDAYAGGLPRAHVVYNDGPPEVACTFLFQSPGHASDDPCWS
jgi:hypothetical protein